MQRNSDVKKLVVGNPEVAKKDLEDLIAKFNRRTKQMAENLKSGKALRSFIGIKTGASKTDLQGSVKSHWILQTYLL